MMISSEAKDSEMDLASPPCKKLKQARLSFQKLSPGLENTSPKSIKKRKISEDSEDDIKILKVIKTNNENVSVGEGKAVLEDTSHIEEIDKKCSSEQRVLKEKDIVLNVNTENGHLKNGERELTKLSEPDKKNANEEIPEEESISSSNEQKVTEVDSDSSDSNSEESSDSENGLNDTIEGHNSSSSHDDVSNREETEINSSKTDVESNSKNDEIRTPKSNVTRAEILRDKKLTPKQLLQREEAAKRREEKEKKRKEKEKKKAEEKEVRQKEKLEMKEKRRREKKEKEEQRRKEKEEKEEQKRKEKEEKEKKKQAELELKSEEKRLKEEERRKKEEQRVLEKRKKDEKKMAEEEIKRKEAAAFANFFLSKGGSKSTEDTKIKAAEHFMPFQVKVDMRLAPVVRTKFTETRQETLEKMLTEQSTTDLYLQQLRKKSYSSGNMGKTWPVSDLREVIILDEDDDVIPVTGDNEVVESHPTITQHKAKLLLFCENRRPPYWGTWSKKSKRIKPTHPFNKDEGFFDYEVDSDDEWEEEEPGESLHGSDDEKESEDEYEVDNEFFVPHGYLSDEENCEEEEETLSPETMKAKLKMLELEFEEEMKHKTERIKPRLLGCFWANQSTNPVGARVLGLLSSYRAVFRENPVMMSRPSTPDNDSPANENQGSCPPSSSKKRKFPETFVPALIKLVHGNINSRGFLVKEFSAYVRSQVLSSKEENQVPDNDKESTPLSSNIGIISKIKISEKIKEISSWIACPEDGPFLNRMCWYVPSEIRTAYGVDDLVIPNKVWNYIITPKRELELSNTIPSPSVVNDMNPRQKSLPLITKFTKKMSPEELQKQLALSGQICTDGDIEILDDLKVDSTLELNGKSSSKEKLDKKSRSNNCEQIVNSRPTPVKSVGSKKSSEQSGARDKLLQFKSKGSSIIPHLESRKRVQILKSVPLGQVISPSTSKMSSSCPKEVQNNGSKPSVNETSDSEECVIVSD